MLQWKTKNVRKFLQIISGSIITGILKLWLTVRPPSFFSCLSKLSHFTFSKFDDISKLLWFFQLIILATLWLIYCQCNSCIYCVNLLMHNNYYHRFQEYYYKFLFLVFRSTVKRTCNVRKVNTLHKHASSILIHS